MKLKDCTRCLVFTTSGQKLDEARVSLDRGKVSLYLKSNPTNETKMKSRVNFFDDQLGLVRTVCSMKLRANPNYPKDSEPWMADCKILEVMDVVQRQQDVRVQVNLETTFCSQRHGFFRGTIENLSAGGMYLTTAQPLDRNETVEFEYKFRRELRRFQMSTLWVKRLPSGRYGYGCQFHNLTDGAESAIREFVFKKQKEKKNPQ